MRGFLSSRSWNPRSVRDSTCTHIHVYTKLQEKTWFWWRRSFNFGCVSPWLHEEQTFQDLILDGWTIRCLLYKWCDILQFVFWEPSATLKVIPWQQRQRLDSCRFEWNPHQGIESGYWRFQHLNDALNQLYSDHAVETQPSPTDVDFFILKIALDNLNSYDLTETRKLQTGTNLANSSSLILRPLLMLIRCTCPFWCVSRKGKLVCSIQQGFDGYLILRGMVQMGSTPSIIMRGSKVLCFEDTDYQLYL